MRNGFCYLTDKLPTDFNGVRLDTRTCIAISCILKSEDSEWTELDKIDYYCYKMFGASLESVCERAKCNAESVIAFISKYLAGAPTTKSWDELNGNISESKSHKSPKTFDFVQDSGAIVSTFRSCYGISLAEITSMHWWEFLALFSNIPCESNALTEIKRIRTMKPDKNDSAERKAEISKAKRAVALKDTRTPGQKEEDRREMFNSIDL